MLKHLLWTSLQSWGEVTQDLSRTEFSQLDAENLEAVVGQYARTALKIEKGLSPNQVESPPAQTVAKCSKGLSSSTTMKVKLGVVQLLSLGNAPTSQGSIPPCSTFQTVSDVHGPTLTSRSTKLRCCRSHQCCVMV